MALPVGAVRSRLFYSQSNFLRELEGSGRGCWTKTRLEVNVRVLIYNFKNFSVCVPSFGSDSNRRLRFVKMSVSLKTLSLMDANKLSRWLIAS